MSIYTRAESSNRLGVYNAIGFVLISLVMLLIDYAFRGVFVTFWQYSADKVFDHASTITWLMYGLYCIGGGLLCAWVAQKMELKPWRFFLCGLLYWSLSLIFLLAYPFMKSENKQHYNRWALFFSFWFVVLYLLPLFSVVYLDINLFTGVYVSLGLRVVGIPMIAIGVVIFCLIPTDKNSPTPTNKPSESWVLWGGIMALICAILQAVTTETILSLTSLFAVIALFGTVMNQVFPVAGFSGIPLTVIDNDNAVYNNSAHARKGLKVSLFYSMLFLAMLFDYSEGLYHGISHHIIGIGGEFFHATMWGLIGFGLIIFCMVWFSIGRGFNEKPFISYGFVTILILYAIYTWFIAYYLYGNELPELQKYENPSLFMAGVFVLLTLRILWDVFITKKIKH